MDYKLVKRAAVQSVVLMIVIILGTYFLRSHKVVESYANEPEGVEEEATTTQKEKIKDPKTIVRNADEEHPFSSVIGFKKVNIDIIDALEKQYLIIRKPESKGLGITVDNLYTSKSILLSLQVGDNRGIFYNMIGRVNNGELFYGLPDYVEYNNVVEIGEDNLEVVELIKDYGNDIVRGISISNHEILIELDRVYESIVLEDDNYYYINLKRPKEVYDNIIVIDAGHGGRDPGAISPCGNYYEKDFNLRILLSLKEFLDKENIKVYYTRLDDKQLYLRPRVDLANDVESDFFISIHCNSNLSPRPNGSEILYYDYKFNDINAKDLAMIFSNQLDSETSLKRNSLQKRQDDDIFILENCKVPAVLIEVGYLSNYKDLNYLIKQENIDKAAKAIYQGIMEAYEVIGG